MSIRDPKWKYTHSTASDIRETFAKARRKLAQEEVLQDQKRTPPKFAQLLPRKRRG